LHNGDDPPREGSRATDGGNRAAIIDREKGPLMMLAVEAMDPTWKMIFFAAAVVLFGLAAVGFQRGKVSFMAAGLGLFAFPFFWDSLAAA
jgi:hypothetical protein